MPRRHSNPGPAIFVLLIGFAALAGHGIYNLLKLIGVLP